MKNRESGRGHSKRASGASLDRAPSGCASSRQKCAVQDGRRKPYIRSWRARAMRSRKRPPELRRAARYEDEKSCFEFPRRGAAFLQLAKQLAAKSVKAAVGHHEDEIAGSRFRSKIFRNFLGGVKSLCLSPGATDRVKNASRRHPLFVTQKIGPVHGSEDGPIGCRERRGQVVFEYPAPHRIRARFEHGP